MLHACVLSIHLYYIINNKKHKNCRFNPQHHYITNSYQLLALPFLLLHKFWHLLHLSMALFPNHFFICFFKKIRLQKLLFWSSFGITNKGNVFTIRRPGWNINCSLPAIEMSNYFRRTSRCKRHYS